MHRWLPLSLLGLTLCCDVGVVHARWQTYAGSPARTSASDQPAVLPLGLVWKFHTPPDPFNLTSPLADERAVYFVNGGELYALDLPSGALRWRFHPDSPIRSSPLLLDDKLIFGCDDGLLYALDAASKQPLWETHLLGQVSTSPLFSDSVLCVAAGDFLYGLNPDTGRTRWLSGLHTRIVGSPAADRGRVFATCQDGTIYCLSLANGHRLWRRQTRLPSPPLTPVLGDGRLFLVARNQVLCYSQTGTPIWSKSLPQPLSSPPAFANGLLYLGGADGSLYALDARAGLPQRGFSFQADSSLLPSPLVTSTAIFLCSARAFIYALDPTSGRLLWRYRTRQLGDAPGDSGQLAILASPAFSQGSLFVLTGGGDLHDFSPEALDLNGPRLLDLSPEGGSAFSSKDTVEVTATLLDEGSGLDESSLLATLDGRAVKAYFDPYKGRLTLGVSRLSDGLHQASISARDYFGNTSHVAWQFSADSRLPAKTGAELTLPGLGGTLLPGLRPPSALGAGPPLPAP